MVMFFYKYTQLFETTKKNKKKGQMYQNGQYRWLQQL